MKIIEMTQVYAREIITWHYEPPYDIYNMTDAYDELMASYYAVVEEEEVIGFMCLGEDAQVPPGDYTQQAIDFGLGMKPSLTGKGYGHSFVKTCMDFIESSNQEKLRLTVADFNKRAIKVYEGLGFIRTQTFKRQERSFHIMVRDLGK